MIQLSPPPLLLCLSSVDPFPMEGRSYALCFYLSWQGSLTSGDSFPLRSNQICTGGVELEGGQRWGWPGRSGVTHSLPPPPHLVHFPSFRKIRFVWSLLFPPPGSVCFLSNLRPLKFEGSLCPSARPQPTPSPGHFSLPYLLPDIPHYLRLRRKKEWHVIKLSLQVCCHQRTYWPSRGHRFSVRHQEVNKLLSEMIKLESEVAFRHHIMLMKKDKPTRKHKSFPSRMKIFGKNEISNLKPSCIY